MSKTKRAENGFTLIELMIAVTIVGILTTIAYPSYQQYILTTWRESAQVCLMEMAQQMERRYAADLAFSQVDSDGDGVDDLFSANCTSDSGMADRYQFKGPPLVNGYRLQALPIGAQTNDGCGTLTVNDIGVKTVSGYLSAQECW